MKMRVLCSVDNTEQNVSEHALSRSLLLADINSLDPEAVAQLPCDNRTWETWLMGDPSRVHDMELLLVVFEVCSMGFIF
jgi:hypothetical protein